MTTLYRRIDIEKRDDINHIFDSKVFEIGDVVELEPMAINYKNPRSNNFSKADFSIADRKNKQFIVVGKRQTKTKSDDPVVAFAMQGEKSIRITHEYDVVRIDDPSIWINNVRFNYIRLDSYKELIFESKIPQQFETY